MTTMARFSMKLEDVCDLQKPRLCDESCTKIIAEAYAEALARYDQMQY